MGSRNRPLYDDFEENPDEECCGESNDVKISSEEEEDGSEVSMLAKSTGRARGGDCRNTDGREAGSNSVFRMDDSVDTEWTDDKHSSYLDSIEASFVKQMYDTEYCALDLCGQAPKQGESSDPDCAESRHNFPSPFDEFKVLQKGCCQKRNFSKTECLESRVVTATKVLASPWIQHFIPIAYSKRQIVPSRTANEIHSNDGTSIADGEQVSAAKSKHFGHMRTVQEAVPHSDRWLCVWNQRQQHNSSGSNSLWGKREQGNIYARKFHLPLASISDKVDQDVQSEAKMGNKRINRILKKHKFNIEGVFCSGRDQVVPLLKTLNSEDGGDCISSSMGKDSSLTDHQYNDIAASSPTGHTIRTFSLKDEKLTGNDGDLTKQDCPESTQPDNRYDGEVLL